MAILGRQLGVTGVPHRVAQFQNAVAAGTPPTTPPPKGQINLDNILTLIPGEVIPIYIAGSGIKVDPVAGFKWPVIVFWVCFVVCAVLRFVASKPQGATGLKGANWPLVIVSLIAFFVWAHAVSTEPGPLITALPAAAWGFFAMVLGVLAPLFVPATK